MGLVCSHSRAGAATLPRGVSPVAVQGSSRSVLPPSVAAPSDHGDVRRDASPSHSRGPPSRSFRARALDHPMPGGLRRRQRLRLSVRCSSSPPRRPWLSGFGAAARRALPRFLQSACCFCSADAAFQTATRPKQALRTAAPPWAGDAARRLGGAAGGHGVPRSPSYCSPREHRQADCGEQYEGDQCDTVAARGASERTQRRPAHGGAAV